MKSILLQGWTAMRIIRLVLGIIIIYQGIVASDALLAVLGGLFTAMALMNAGCCGAGGCAVPRNQSRTHQKNNEVEYEEVHNES